MSSMKRDVGLFVVNFKDISAVDLLESYVDFLAQCIDFALTQ